MNVKTFVKSIIFQDANGEIMLIKESETKLKIITNDGVLYEGIVKSIYDNSLILLNNDVMDCIYFDKIKYASFLGINCKHEWRFLTNEGGIFSQVLQCLKCGERNIEYY
jgi:hypothetical protein